MNSLRSSFLRGIASTVILVPLSLSPVSAAQELTLPAGFPQTISNWAQTLSAWVQPYLQQKNAMVTISEVLFYDTAAEDQELSILHGAANGATTIYEFENGLTESQQKYESRRVKACLTVLPTKYRKQIKKITIRAGKVEPRGLANGEQIILATQNLSTREVCNVVIHEAGHVIDLGYLTGSGEEMSAFRDGAYIPANDPSVGFYSISWSDEKTRKKESSDLDFISGYARSDAFEDFGESMTTYVRQGNYFRSLLGTSEVLRAKYNFLRYTVFAGIEYDSGKASETPWTRVYDATRIGVEK